MNDKIELSNLGHTWIFDLDGTLVKHNGYKIDGEDTLLEGVLDMLNQIPEADMIVILTSREEKYKEETIKFLDDNNIRYDKIMFGVPMGERIVVNDIKPGGLKTAMAINLKRDDKRNISIDINDEL